MSCHLRKPWKQHPSGGAGKELDAPLSALVGTAALLLTLRFFNVLAEVNALGGKEKAQPRRGYLRPVDVRLSLDYRLLATLESSRSEDVFGVIETTM